MQEAKFTESEVAYMLDALGKYYHIEEIRKVMRLLAAKFIEENVWSIKNIWTALTGKQ